MYDTSSDNPAYMLKLRPAEASEAIKGHEAKFSVASKHMGATYGLGSTDEKNGRNSKAYPL